MWNQNQRVKLEDSFNDMMYKISEGNPGAVSVLCDIYKHGQKIDPQCAGSLLHVLSFDAHGIYGSRIWMLFKDVCGQNLSKTVACMRAMQLGIISDATLDHAIDNRGEGLDLEATMIKVKEELPQFDLEYKP